MPPLWGLRRPLLDPRPRRAPSSRAADAGNTPTPGDPRDMPTEPRPGTPAPCPRNSLWRTSRWRLRNGSATSYTLGLIAQAGDSSRRTAFSRSAPEPHARACVVGPARPITPAESSISKPARRRNMFGSSDATSPSPHQPVQPARGTCRRRGGCWRGGAGRLFQGAPRLNRRIGVEQGARHPHAVADRPPTASTPCCRRTRSPWPSMTAP